MIASKVGVKVSIPVYKFTQSKKKGLRKHKEKKRLEIYFHFCLIQR